MYCSTAIPTPGVIRATIPCTVWTRTSVTTGVVAAQFPDVHFIEEGLCGRTICSTDPIDYGRNGMAMLPACWQRTIARRDRYHARHKRQQGNVRPLPFTISDAMDRTIKLMQSPLLWSNTMQKPQILLVAPPKMGENLADSVYYGMFDESSAALIRALPARFRMLAEKYGCAFVDGSAVTAAKCSDQIHLTAEEHAVLGRLIADRLRELL